MLRRPTIPLFVTLISMACASCSNTTDTSAGDTTSTSSAVDAASAADDALGGDDAASEGASLPVGACRDDDDCEPGTMCTYPGPVTGCGICYTPEEPEPDAPPMPSLCGTDADCDGTICEQDPCLCEGGGWCVSGCSVTGCEDWQSCGAGDRCAAKACTSGDDCPVNYSCLTGDEGDTCQGTPCSTDGDCDGTCVLGQCWPEPGVCRGPIG